MSMITLYHNPRCSKSRQTLQLLQQQGIEPEIVLYLENPPGVSKIAALLDKLGMSARDLLRKGEEEYKTLHLEDTSLCEAALIKTMAENPRLIERPIVETDDRAVLGRPPEQVLDILQKDCKYSG